MANILNAFSWQEIVVSSTKFLRSLLLKVNLTKLDKAWYAQQIQV